MIPNKTKFRKMQKGSLKGMAKARHFVEFGEIGMQALSRGYVSSKQLESARIVINKFLNRTGKVIFRVIPDKPLTSKPIQTRMGKGKGAVSEWVASIKPGMVMIEIAGNVSLDLAREALRKASCKLSVNTRCVESVEMV